VRLDHDGPAPDGQAGTQWLMVRRNQRTGELAFYRCSTPRPTPLAVLVRVAGRRWTVEEATLAILAHAFLVVAALAERTRRPPPSALIPMTCNKLQRLFAALLGQPVGDRGHRLRWSVWRRRHKARARTCHYRRQAAHL
jgi:hypothetical protein